MVTPSIFITGATGFVGAALVRHFTQREWRVIASGKSAAPGNLPAAVRYVQADICRSLPVQNADIVVHAAALASDSVSWEALKQSNVGGTRQVFEATRNCKIFVFISSSSVYDLNNDLHFEDEPTDISLLSPYGRSKRAAEEWLLQQNWEGRTLIILRPRAIYGCGDRILLPRLLRLVRSNQIIIPGDMHIQSSLTHIDNLCDAVVQCLAYYSQSGGGLHIFNIADATPYTMRTVVQQVLSAVNSQELPVRNLPMLPLKMIAHVTELLHIKTSFTALSLAAASRHTILDTRKLAETMGFVPTYNFWDTVPHLVHWVHRVGIENVRNAKQDLPWTV